MTSTTFTARNGSQVRIEIATSKTSWSDGYEIEVDDYRVDMHANGKTLTNVGLVDHPQHGLCIQTATGIGPVPAAAAEAVKAVFAEYRAEVARRRAAADALEAKYQAGRERLRRVMGY